MIAERQEREKEPVNAAQAHWESAPYTLPYIVNGKSQAGRIYTKVPLELLILSLQAPVTVLTKKRAI